MKVAGGGPGIGYWKMAGGGGAGGEGSPRGQAQDAEGGQAGGPGPSEQVAEAQSRHV